MKYGIIPKETIAKRLNYICTKENVSCDLKTLETIAQISQGDIRNAINTLQYAFTFYGKEKITEDNIYLICDKPQPVLIKEVLSACLKKDIKSAINKVYKLKELGFSEQDITLGMINYLRYCNDIKEIQKNLFLDKICMTTFIISKGLGSMIQITGCIAQMIQCVK